MTDVVVKIEGEPDYPLDVDATLADLTGDETVMLEDYLGGWDKLSVKSARSLIVTVWLAKRQAGKAVSLQEISGMKGLVFGETVDIVEVNGGPPAEAAEAANTTPSIPEISGTTGVGI